MLYRRGDFVRGDFVRTPCAFSQSLVVTGGVSKLIFVDPAAKIDDTQLAPLTVVPSATCRVSDSSYFSLSHKAHRHISQGSVATQLRCDCIFNSHLIVSFLPSVTVKKIHNDLSIFGKGFYKILVFNCSLWLTVYRPIHKLLVNNLTNRRWLRANFHVIVTTRWIACISFLTRELRLR